MTRFAPPDELPDDSRWRGTVRKRPGPAGRRTRTCATIAAGYPVIFRLSKLELRIGFWCPRTEWAMLRDTVHNHDNQRRTRFPMASHPHRAPSPKSSETPSPTAEEQRLAAARDDKVPWRFWGPYLSER